MLPALAIRRDQIEWDLESVHGTRAIVRPRIGFAANRQTILADAARAGLGIANLPEFLIKAIIRAFEEALCAKPIEV
jgi:DNA-binding transcriptional LysR family regulator